MRQREKAFGVNYTDIDRKVIVFEIIFEFSVKSWINAINFIVIEGS